MSESELQPRVKNKDLHPEVTRLSPVDRKLADLPPGKYYKLSEVSEILGVSQSWLRRKLKKSGIKAPSMVMPMGDGPSVYLYTQDDIEELRSIKDRPIQERRSDD